MEARALYVPVCLHVLLVSFVQLRDLKMGQFCSVYSKFNPKKAFVSWG